jgi:putative restriction endonuclease
MFAIAATDNDWFASLQQSPPPRIVNFWTPTQWGVRRLPPGARLFFMLKSPIRLIGGYGTFVRYLDRSASSAWEAYGLGNGVASKDELVAKVSAFALKHSANFVPSPDPTIGCIELRDVVTLDVDDYIDPLDYGVSFPSQVVKLKYFDGPDLLGSALGNDIPGQPFELVQGIAPRTSSTRKDRKGQSAFRQLVLRNYNYRCCILGETVVQLLEAAHIQPYINKFSNHPQNGLCLRVDLHRLFDEGLISITSEHLVRVSERLKGTSYAILEGRKITFPADHDAYPSQQALAAHRAAFRP